MKILTVPEDTAILRTKSAPVGKIDAEFLAFLKELGETLKRQKDPAGVGLSAIQVGRQIRAFATWLPQLGTRAKGQGLREKPVLQFYVNPEIVGHASKMTLGEELTEKRPGLSGKGLALSRQPFLEGCLSIPDIYGPVLRWPWIKATAAVFSEKDLLDISQHGRLDLQLIDISLNGLADRVFQHELDHLNGILFTDRIIAQGNSIYKETGGSFIEIKI